MAHVATITSPKTNKSLNLGSPNQETIFLLLMVIRIILEGKVWGRCGEPGRTCGFRKALSRGLEGEISTLGARREGGLQGVPSCPLGSFWGAKVLQNEVQMGTWGQNGPHAFRTVITV